MGNPGFASEDPVWDGRTCGPRSNLLTLNPRPPSPLRRGLVDQVDLSTGTASLHTRFLLLCLIPPRQDSRQDPLHYSTSDRHHLPSDG